MKKLTVLKFGGFVLLLVSLPFIISCVSFYIFDSYHSIFLGFLIGMALDAVIIIFVMEPLFKSTIKYLNKKEKEREIRKQQLLEEPEF